MDEEKELIKRSTRKLEQSVAEHLRTISSVLGEQIEAHPDLEVGDCRYKRKLREVISEVIFVLEETRKSFKSKRLAQLRRKLISILGEID